MPMPSVEDLQTMYGAWNPQAYLQAQDNAGLERQFREQQYNQETEKAKQEQLSTLFQQQNDPLKLEGKRLENQNLGYTGTGLQYDNEAKARNNRIAAANETYKINADKAEMLAKLSKAQLEEGESAAKRMMMSLDPVEQERGKKLYGLTAHARDLADARQQALDVARVTADSHIKGIGMQVQGNKDLEKMRIDAGKYDKKGSLAVSVDDRLYKAKSAAEKAEILESAYYAAQANGDVEEANKYAARALEARKRAAEDAANRGVATPRPDTAALGIPSVAGPAANAPIAGNNAGQAGTTKSGIKYRVVP